MRPHHTKDKGDVGVAHAIADLADQGYLVLTALCEHAPFDLVGYRDGSFIRVSVKYRSALPSGAVQVQFRSSWADSNGNHARPIDKDDIDVLCIYCPDTRACYYVDPKNFGRSVTLRVVPSRNNELNNVLMADEFRDVPTGITAHGP
jgi:hypothetical protein